jgi:hypothetical protein
MFDQQHGDAALVANAADQVAEDVDFLVVQAARRTASRRSATVAPSRMSPCFKIFP